MYVKIQSACRHIVAVCDKEILGKTFEQGKFQLDVKESFFKGDEKNKHEVIEIMKNMKKEDATFNIVGNKSTQTALEAGIITQEGIRKIAGISFALVLL